MTPEEADDAQDWDGMDGATAFLLIERHADGWDEIRQMMDAWLRANVAAAILAERESRQAAQLQVAELQERLNRADAERCAAVLAERDECAKLIEDSPEWRGKGWVSFLDVDTKREIAAAIRARGTK